MNKYKRLISRGLFIAFLVFNYQLNAQDTQVATITIEECYVWAKDNYPLIKQLDLIEKSTEYNLDNASIGNLPQINIQGQATYQSAVTSFPLELPNVDVPTVDKHQYKVYGEVYQPLTNFHNVNAHKALINANGEIEKQKIEVEIYQINDRIHQLYFGILLIDEKVNQLQIIQSDLDSAMVKVKAAINNGTATLTDDQLLHVEMLSIAQQLDENQANKSAFIAMLANLTQQPLDESTIFQPPADVNMKVGNFRPELSLFNLQAKAIDLQFQQIDNRWIPNVGLFAQGGFGKPGLNFLSNEFDPYYLTGLKVNWNLSALYNSKRDKKLLRINHDKIESQRETFLLNTKLVSTQQSAEIEKFKTLIQRDIEIIKLREAVKETAQVQLTNGLITTIDFVQILNEVNKARQLYSIHKTQMQLAQYNLKLTTGN